jgi:hypothetical protein
MRLVFLNLRCMRTLASFKLTESIAGDSALVLPLKMLLLCRYVKLNKVSTLKPIQLEKETFKEVYFIISQMVKKV